ncbi:MAG TPA: hypothetical protein VE195_06700 [Acidobacteriaceae bacterium]|nr:hypothetical protein [Acidobacteriaceae bacterium]
MSYLLRFVQTYEPSSAQAFFALEAEFKQLEHRSPKLPQGRRSQMLSEGKPTNVLIWESEFSSLQDVEVALKKLADDPTHTSLFARQRPFILDMRTEIHKVLEL